MDRRSLLSIAFSVSVIVCILGINSNIIFGSIDNSSNNNTITTAAYAQENNNNTQNNNNNPSAAGGVGGQRVLFP
ncbi:MAG TPA: hypothetical protein VE619_11055, partial [Nitrososphaeraceae archaeon]|nr:hypothetical protein [Nitrososphaeraceae archaeon]